MRLTLAVLRCPASAVTETRSFDGGEIGLGRGLDSDWVLADPERQLSKRHCVLAFHGGGWQVADVSKNGTYLNGASQPLGQGRTSPLENGDRLRMGDYELEVRIAPAPAASPWADPAWRPERGVAVAGKAWQDDPFRQDPFQTPLPAQPAPIGIGSGIGERSITLPADYDPMAPEHGPDGDRNEWRQPTQSDHGHSLDEAFRPARMATPGPDDWDDLLAGLPGSSPTPQSTARAAAGPFGSDPLPFEPAPQTPPVIPAAAPAPARETISDGALVAALLSGAGMENLQIADPKATMEQAGAMLRAAVAGLRQVLIARAAVKSEFRIDQTLLSTRGNNPLKVSVDDDSALDLLLHPCRASDLPPAKAVANALRDIRVHEMATMTAMQTAIRAVVASFDPAPLMQNAGGGLSMQRKAKAWDSFEALHAKLVQGLSDDFDSVFGKSFARAYEQAQHELTGREGEER